MALLANGKSLRSPLSAALLGAGLLAAACAAGSAQAQTLPKPGA
jgi:hypothetical protein